MALGWRSIAEQYKRERDELRAVLDNIIDGNMDADACKNLAETTIGRADKRREEQKPPKSEQSPRGKP